MLNVCARGCLVCSVTYLTREVLPILVTFRNTGPIRNAEPLSPSLGPPRQEEPESRQRERQEREHGARKRRDVARGTAAPRDGGRRGRRGHAGRRRRRNPCRSVRDGGCRRRRERRCGCR